MPAKKSAPKKQKSFEESLWETATKLRGSVESSEYKHVVLSLIFLKFVSDKFEGRRAELIAEGKEKYTDMVEFYTMQNVFYLPETAPAGATSPSMPSRTTSRSRSIPHSPWSRRATPRSRALCPITTFHASGWIPASSPPSLMRSITSTPSRIRRRTSWGAFTNTSLASLLPQKASSGVNTTRPSASSS